MSVTGAIWVKHSLIVGGGEGGGGREGGLVV